MSVTAVPLRPIAKGSIAKLWIGVALAVAVAGGGAWLGTSGAAVANAGTPEQFLAWNGKQDSVVTTATGLQFKVIEQGKGAKPTDTDVVLVGYKGTLRDGKVFDENPQASFPVAGVVPGFSEGLKLMAKGGKYRLWIPPALGYGENSPAEVIPANAVLIFDVELLDFRSMAEIQAQMQQMQAQGAMPPGGPEGR